MKDLKAKTIRGGFAKICAQGAAFVVRIGSLMVLARLLSPKDFGLVGMVTAVIGVLSLFRDFGLSTASVQRTTITEEQMSTLFWINILVGLVLAAISVTIAPIVAAFYHEPRLVWVTAALAVGFPLNAAGVQHGAILQRQMRFTSVAVIDVLSLFISTAVGIVMALRGYRYWALVGMALSAPVVSTICVWLATAWFPGKPCRRAGIRSMMRFGGTITLNGLVVYIAYNLEKVLLGRFWGAEAIGIYGRAYQLINVPTDNLNSAVGGVAFSALSRVQEDPSRLRSYFLKGYTFVVALTIPVTIVCTVFAQDMIGVVLGPKWKEAIPIFRLLAPTMLIFAMINPLAWLLFSIGKVERSLKIALVLAPLVIGGYILGLPYGPKGVAFGYSAVLILWVVPHIAWCVHGTGISLRDILLAVARPLVSGILAAAVALGILHFCSYLLGPLPRLALGCGVLGGVYILILLFVMGEKKFYLELIRGLKRRSPTEEDSLVPA
jgi:O-antigen/teichoic acid export membrane protein